MSTLPVDLLAVLVGALPVEGVWVVGARRYSVLDIFWWGVGEGGVAEGAAALAGVEDEGDAEVFLESA